MSLVLSNPYDDAFGGFGIFLNSAPGSGAWPAANRALLLPFVVPEPITIAKLWWFNGSSVSGNVKAAGGRQSDGLVLVQTASTAQSGTSVVQEADITDTTLAAGDYYLLLAMDNNTGTMFRGAPSGVALRMAGMAQEALTAFAIPTNLTPATLSAGYVPMCGYSLRTLVA